MKSQINRFWNETDGAVLSAEIMLVGSILVLGVIVGLTAVRDSVVTELADVGQAFANISQSYCYSGIDGHGGYSGGGHFQDKQDFCDGRGEWGGQRSKCVNVAVCDGGERK